MKTVNKTQTKVPRNLDRRQNTSNPTVSYKRKLFCGKKYQKRYLQGHTQPNKDTLGELGINTQQEATQRDTVKTMKKSHWREHGSLVGNIITAYITSDYVNVCRLKE